MISMVFDWLHAVWTRGKPATVFRLFLNSLNSFRRRIKIWQLDESTGNWSVEDDWKVRNSFLLQDGGLQCRAYQAHDAAVTTVSWAHPEFGTIIASSSFDRTVKIWEQTSYAEVEQPQVNGASSSASTTRWTERTVLVDAKFSVRAVEFAPQHFGLKLVSSFDAVHLVPLIPITFLCRHPSPPTTIFASTNVLNSPLSPLGSWPKKSTFFLFPQAHLRIIQPRIQSQWPLLRKQRLHWTVLP